MVRKKTNTILSDSYLMYNKKVPAFGFILIATVLVLLIGSFIWSFYGRKTYVIKSQGVIVSKTKDYVMSEFAGEIKDSKLKEGYKVKKGEELFKVSSSEKKENVDIQSNQLKTNRDYYANIKSKYELLLKSFKNGQNYFDNRNNEDSMYSSMFNTYINQINQNKVDVNMLKQYEYTDDQIQEEINKNNSKNEEIRQTFITNTSSKIEECNNQISNIDSQLSSLGIANIDNVVVAKTDGIIHLSNPINNGMVIQTGGLVATISSDTDDKIIESYISTADMARIKKNDDVQIAIDGLSQNSYGTIKGKVISIDYDATDIQNETNSQKIFKLQIKPYKTELKNEHGSKVKLKNGMTCESRIIYDKVTYFEYLLDKLGIKSR